VEHARRTDLEPHATRDGSFNDVEVDLVTVLLEGVEGE
jgi:hypothetical protein